MSPNEFFADVPCGRVVFAGGSFRKGPTVSLGEGFGVRFRGVVGGGFPVESKGEREGGWGGWGRDRQKSRQVNA